MTEIRSVITLNGDGERQDGEITKGHEGTLGEDVLIILNVVMVT